MNAERSGGKILDHAYLAVPFFGDPNEAECVRCGRPEKEHAGKVTQTEPFYENGQIYAREEVWETDGWLRKKGYR